MKVCQIAVFSLLPAFSLVPNSSGRPFQGTETSTTSAQSQESDHQPLSKSFTRVDLELVDERIRAREISIHREGRASAQGGDSSKERYYHRPLLLVMEREGTSNAKQAGQDNLRSPEFSDLSPSTTSAFLVGSAGTPLSTVARFSTFA